jgi:hypothetical protein
MTLIMLSERNATTLANVWLLEDIVISSLLTNHLWQLYGKQPVCLVRECCTLYDENKCQH